jgi:hypothetical protein
MAAQNADGTTSGVSGKVKASSAAAVIASAVVTFLFKYGDQHVAGIHDFVSGTTGAVVFAVLVAALAGVFTFAAGYVARHVPTKMVKDVEDVYAAEQASVAQRANEPNE